MAGSIKLFSFVQKFSQVMGTYPLQTNQNGHSINSKNWFFIISFLLFGLSSAAFLVFEAKSMFDYGISFYGASVAVFFMCVYLSMVWKMENALTFIKICERFIESRGNSIVAYRELIEKIERLCELLGIAGLISILFVTLPFLIYSLVNNYVLDLGEESFVLLFPTKWAFDWKTPLGYITAWFVQAAGCVASALTAIIFLNLIFGSCWLFMFMADDITEDLAAFNNDVKSNANRVEWMKRFCDLIQIYSDAKECVNEFNAIVKYSLFINMIYFMLSVTSILLTLQFQFQSLDENMELFETFVLVTLALWVFGTLFFICELGERMTYHFDMVRDELERCNWHKLPIKMQRMHLIFLSDTQQPKITQCFGNILCTRKTFEEITNNGFSYFMILRQFEI